jgi:hypothetical protein
VAARAASPPPALTPAEKFAQAADALQSWTDDRGAPWSPRPVSAQPSFPREQIATLFANRWEGARAPLRSVYARLSYTRAAKSDQWLQLGGGLGTPHLDAYFAALTAPFSQTLLALDGLRQTLSAATGAALSDADRATLAATATAARELIATFTSDPDLKPMDAFARALSPPLLQGQVSLERDPKIVAASCTFPSVRDGADLALFLTVMAGVAAQSLPAAESVTLVLYEQGLPLLDVEIPGGPAADFPAGRLDLPRFWQSWKLTDYLAGRALSPLELLPAAAALPAEWKVANPRLTSPRDALLLGGLGAKLPAGEDRGAAQEDVTGREGTAHLGVLVGSTPAVMHTLGREATDHPSVSVWTLSEGPVLWIGTGDEAALQVANAAWARVFVPAGQPPVEVPPPVLASLQIRPDLTAPPVAVAAAPPVPLPAGQGCVVRALVCASVDEHNQPQGVTDHFPAGQAVLTMYFEIADAPANTELTLEWSCDGRLLLRQSVIVSGSGKIANHISSDGGLPSGAYQVNFLQGGNQVYQVNFRIG